MSLCIDMIMVGVKCCVERVHTYKRYYRIHILKVDTKYTNKCHRDEIENFSELFSNSVHITY